MDSGTHESMLEASNFIHTIEKRTGLKIACIEEIAYKLNYIDKNKLVGIIESIGNNQYADYLNKIIKWFLKILILLGLFFANLN